MGLCHLLVKSATTQDTKTKQDTPRVSRRCTYVRQSRQFSVCAASLNLTFLRLSADSGRVHTESFFLPPRKPSLQPAPRHS